MSSIRHRAALAALLLPIVCFAQEGDDAAPLREEIEALRAGQEEMRKDLAEIRRLLEQGTRAAPGQQGFQARDLEVGESATRGAHGAAVTLFEYSDYQCPFCRRHATTVMPQLLEQYVDSGKLRVVMREYPIETIHPRALAASKAAVCAGEQGRYWEMHDLLFADQQHLTDEVFAANAESLGLDAGAFAACLADGATEARIRADQREAQSMGITGTPSFVIGLTGDDPGKVRVTDYIRGAQALPAFQAVIDRLLEASGDGD